MEQDALRPPTGALWPHILLWLLQVVAFVVPPFRGRRPLCALAIVAAFAISQRDPHVFDDPQRAQPLTIGWANMLSSLEKLLFEQPSPEATLYHIDRVPGEALQMQPFGLAKLRWALVLLVNMRGIRWNYQVKNVPPVRYGTRAAWLRQQTLNTVWYMLMADLTGNLGRRLFYTSPDGSSRAGIITVLHPDPRISFLKTLVFGAIPYYMLSFQYTLMGLIAVLLGISRPDDWPAHFGSAGDASTVRAFWGKYWHQTLRRPLTAFSGALVDGLGIRRGTNLSSYTQLWFSFLLSGFMHGNGFRAVPRPASMTTQHLLSGWLAFFVWQATAITFEDLLQWIWRRIGGPSHSLLRLVGYLWVIGNLWVSLPMIADIVLSLRAFEAPMLPFSITLPLMQYVPIPS